MNQIPKTLQFLISDSYSGSLAYTNGKELKNLIITVAL